MSKYKDDYVLYSVSVGDVREAAKEFGIELTDEEINMLNYKFNWNNPTPCGTQQDDAIEWIISRREGNNEEN